VVRIGRCTGCGTYISEVWTSKDECIECGEEVEHINEDLGPIEHLPRAFNIGGLIMVIIAVILFIAAPVGNDGGGEATGPLILLVASVMMFLGSLASQVMLVRKAIDRRSSVQINERPVRRRPSPARKNREMKTGKVGGERKVARKILER
jgi:DNA-directed RNA polymerase subunit N (RpoN/RPB10)